MADMNVGNYLSSAIDIYKKDIGNWIVIGLVGYLALGVGMWGGFHNCTLKAMRGEKPEIGDVLAPFSRIVDFLIPAILIAVGFMFCFIPGLLLATWWFFAWPMILEKNMGWKEATAASKAKVQEIGLVPVLITAFVSSFLGGLFYFITAPFAGIIPTIAYKEHFPG